MRTVMLACGALIRHINAAQKQMGTSHPVLEMDGRLHSVPQKMREALFLKMENLPEHFDTDDCCNGYKSKHINSSYGSMDIYVPQDCKSTFKAQEVKNANAPKPCIGVFKIYAQ